MAWAIQQHARRPGDTALLSQRDSMCSHGSGGNPPELFYSKLITGVHEPARGHVRLRFLLFPVFPYISRLLRGDIEIRCLTQPRILLLRIGLPQMKPLRDVQSHSDELV